MKTHLNCSNQQENRESEVITTKINDEVIETEYCVMCGTRDIPEEEISN